MEFVEFKGKTLDEALMQASVELGCASTDLEYNVVSEGSTGFLGLIGSKPFVISARKKKTFVDDVREYLETLFKAMDIQADIKIEFNETENLLDIDVEGPEMGILIGKRGQTLDALQYLISLAVNKKSDSYIRVKLDTENYRARRKETLENLAKNIAFKVKRTKRSFALERCLKRALMLSCFLYMDQIGHKQYGKKKQNCKNDPQWMDRQLLFCCRGCNCCTGCMFCVI